MINVKGKYASVQVRWLADDWVWIIFVVDKRNKGIVAGAEYNCVDVR